MLVIVCNAIIPIHICEYHDKDVILSIFFFNQDLGILYI